VSVQRELLGRLGVRRLLDDSKTERPRVLRFFHEYFGYHTAPEVFKEDKEFRDHEAAMLVADTDKLVEHILLGVDHLLFVLALILIARNTRELIKAITAFTVAHSITLAGATLGFVHVPPKPVEAAIALSIAFVALEIVRARDGEPGIAARAPWLVAFAFGLLHGFGFAGALSEIGLPAGHIPVALLFFNVGVEIGQLLFVAVVLSLAALVRLGRRPLPQWSALIPPYLIGSLAMFWVIQRASVF
jgi:hydrogenase/urease accessory protein HupE